MNASSHRETPAAPEGQISTEVDKSPSVTPELLERIDEVLRLQTVIAHEMHSGPMPSPAQLDQYEKVLEGTAKIIRDEFQANGAHVRQMETRAIEAQKDDNDRNRHTAERLVWGALVLSGVMALTGHDWVAGVLAVSTVGAVVTGFLHQRSDKQRDSKPPTDGAP